MGQEAANAQADEFLIGRHQQHGIHDFVQEVGQFLPLPGLRGDDQHRQKQRRECLLGFPQHRRIVGQYGRPNHVEIDIVHYRQIGSHHRETVL